MALAAVSTPDVAKDLFSGLWDQKMDQELYQAYQNMDTSSSSNQYNTIFTTLPSYTCTAPSTDYITTDAVYITTRATTGVYTTGVDATTGAYTTCVDSTPAYTVASPSYITTTCAPPVYNAAPSPAYTSPAYTSPGYTTSPAYSTSPVYNCESPVSSSSNCSDPGVGGGGGTSVSEYTKLALLLISQSQQKDLPRAEQEKRRLRRERNKIAATKCREKRRAHSVNVGVEYNQVINTTKELEDEISVLKRERDELARLLDTHYCHNPSLGRSATPRNPIPGRSATPRNPTLGRSATPKPSLGVPTTQHQQLHSTPPAILHSTPPLPDMFIKTEPVPHLKNEPGSYF